MRSTSRRIVSGALLAALTGLTACGEDLQSQELTAQGSESAATLTAEQALQQEAGQKLTHALALSLREPAMRGLIRAAMAETLVKEDKVHFNTFVRGSGRALLQTMSRASGLSVAELETLVQQAGSLEMYLPVKEHRAAWRGGEDLLVATQFRDHETPVGFDLSGNPVLLSATKAPEIPTLVLVPAEDFDAEGNPSQRGLALGRGAQQQEKATGGVSAAYAYTGAYVQYLYIPDEFEAWARGAPEYEMYLERVGSSRQVIRCAAAGSIAPFKWNMDGTTWSSPFLIAWESETPTLDGLAMYFYEDDDTECKLVQKDGKDYLKLTMDALKNSYSAYKSYQEKQYIDAIINFYHAAVAIKSIISGSDEYVGTVTSFNGQPLDGTTKRFNIKNENQQDKGYVDLVWTTYNF
jgi:hypothetical protein